MLLLFPNFDIKSIIFSQLWLGAFSQNYWTKPCKVVKATEDIFCLFDILGNHEYYTIDVHNWMKKLASMGIHVLHNENVKLPSKGDSVCLAGVNDPLAEEYQTPQQWRPLANKYLLSI